MDGTDLCLDEQMLVAWPLPVDEGGDKYSRGTVLMIGGSPTTPGAIILAGMAALRVGAGRLQIVTASTIAQAVAVAVPESLAVPVELDDDGLIMTPFDHELTELVASADAVLIGSGLMPHAGLVGVVAEVVRHVSDRAVVVVDAAALGALPDVPVEARRRLFGRMLLTPNRQEVDLLVTPGAHDPLAEVASTFGAVVTSFGRVVADDARRWTTDLGHPSLGTSGSGDVLAGMATGFAARCRDAAQAACWATHVHAATGRRLGEQRGHLGFLARELIDAAVGPCQST